MEAGGDHSGITQQGAQQPAGTKSLRETNVELREENLKTSPENLIILLLRGFLSALSFPKLPGDGMLRQSQLVDLTTHGEYVPSAESFPLNSLRCRFFSGLLWSC